MKKLPMIDTPELSKLYLELQNAEECQMSKSVRIVTKYVKSKIDKVDKAIHIMHNISCSLSKQK